MSLDSIHGFHVKSCSQGNALLEGKKSFPAARQHRKQVIHFVWNQFGLPKYQINVVISDATDEGMLLLNSIQKRKPREEEFMDLCHMTYLSPQGGQTLAMYSSIYLH